MSRTLVLVAAAVLAAGLSACAEDAATMPATKPSTSADVQPPAGHRFVGAGHLAIAVPESWARNSEHCATPTADTYIVDVGAFNDCLVPRPAGVESVWIETGEARPDFAGDQTVEIDGVSAQRQDTTCATEHGDVEVCRGVVFFPAEKVAFRAESSTGEAEVEAMLAKIRVLPDQLAVLNSNGFFNDDQARSGETYLAALEAAGFRTEERQELRRGLPDGFVLAVEPLPGTMARPGDLVTVTTSGGGAGPADELTVAINSHSAEGTYDTPQLDDQQIRDGATITLRVGDSVWAYASGTHEETLAGVVEGAALTASTWKEDPNKGHSWVAAAPGTSSLTLTITVDGEKIELGTVTVLVRPAAR